MDELCCKVCGREIDDEYGECEACGKIVCSKHNDLVKGICPDCRMREGK
jgi:hypothetical protein